MKRGRTGCVVAAALLCSVTASTDLAAQMFVPTGRETLRGLPGVEVAVEVPLEVGGVTRAAIAERVMASLQSGGVRVYASQAENDSPAKPYLYVHVNVLELPSRDLYAVGLQVQLRQALRSPVTDSTIVNAMTWDVHNVVAASASELSAVVDEVEAFVDRFIEDWRWSRGTPSARPGG